ncbi:MAG: TIM barrel protein, partial [Ktedonobacteraceae bacterium]
LTAPEMSALLAETGLRAVATHLRLDALQGLRLDEAIRYCEEIGCSNIVLPSLPHEQRTHEGVEALAPQLNTIGQQCQQHGITFSYHNHDFEFTQVDGAYLLNYLLQSTDSSLVKLELDVYWAAFAGVDPIAFLQAHADRIALIHLKDMKADRSMTEVGKGILDMQGICTFAEEHSLWGIVEHDHPEIPSLESAKISLEYFK